MERTESIHPKSSRPGIAELSLARIARFYHVDPFSVPIWWLDILQRSIDPLKAEEMIRDITMTRIAGAKQEDFSRAIRKLERLSEPDMPAPPAPIIKPGMVEWFEQNKIPYRLH